MGDLRPLAVPCDGRNGQRQGDEGIDPEGRQLPLQRAGQPRAGHLCGRVRSKFKDDSKQDDTMTAKKCKKIVRNE